MSYAGPPHGRCRGKEDFAVCGVHPARAAHFGAARITGRQVSLRVSSLECRKVLGVNQTSRRSVKGGKRWGTFSVCCLVSVTLELRKRVGVSEPVGQNQYQ